MKPYRDIVYPQDGTVGSTRASSTISMAGADSTARGPNADGDINANIESFSPNYLLLEDGTPLLLEDGTSLLLEA